VYHSGQVRFHDDLVPLMQDIDSVEQHPDNYNNGDTDAIIESIQVNGMFRPIYVERATNLILMGNHTWAACKELGAKSIPVIYLDSAGADSLRSMIADNYTATLARPDNPALLRLLQRIDEEYGTVLGTGMNDDAMERLRKVQDSVESTPFGDFPGGSPGVTRLQHTCPNCGHEFNTVE
jgi:ParB-like chromosome segregation protein Spo0J